MNNKQFVKLKKYIALAVRAYRRQYIKECKYAGNPDYEIIRAYTKGALDAYETMAYNLKVKANDFEKKQSDFYPCADEDGMVGR